MTTDGNKASIAATEAMTDAVRRMADAFQYFRSQTFSTTQLDQFLADHELGRDVEALWRCLSVVFNDSMPVVRREIENALLAARSPLPDQAPAVECAVILRGMGSALVGSLSIAPGGGLRMLSAIDGAGPIVGKIPMVEQFFDWDDVLCFGVRREVTVERTSPIIRSS